MKLNDGTTIRGDDIVICTNGFGFTGKLNLKKMDVYAAQLDACEGLPPCFIEKTEQNKCFKGMKDGPNSKRFRVVAVGTTSKDDLTKYVNDRIPGRKIVEFKQYKDVRSSKEGQVTLVERDQESGLIFVVHAHASKMPLEAEKVLKIIYDKS